MGVFPLIMTPIGVAAILAAVVILWRTGHSSWLVWVLVGLGLGVAGYFVSAWLNVLNPGPATGGSGASAGK